MAEELEAEIRGLHVFLEEWLSGRMTADDAVFSRDFADHLSEDFAMIQPGGTRSDKAATVAAIRAGYGKSPDFRISIHRVEAVVPAGAPDTLAAAYEEHQTGALNSQRENVRLSTVLFERGADGRLKWRHLQETWAPGSQPVAPD